MFGRKRAVMFALAVALAAAVVAAPSFAQIRPVTADRQAAEVLPPGTVLLIELRDISATGERGRESAIYKLVADQRIMDYLGPVTEGLGDAVEQIDQALQDAMEVSLGDLGKLVNGRITLAITDVSVMPPGAKVVVMLKPNDPAHMQEMMGKLIPEDLAMMAAARTVQGVELKQIGQGVESIAWAVAEDMFIFGLGEGAAADVLNRMAEPGQNLLNSPTYAAVYQQVAEYDRDWLFYVNLERPLMMAQALGGADVANIINEMGLNQLKGMAIAGKFEGDLIDDIFYLHMPGEPRGLTGLLAGQPIDMELLNLIPANAYQFSLMRLSLADLYDALMGAVEKIDVDAHADLMEMIEEFEEEMEVNIRGDIIASLGDEVIMYELPKPAEMIRERVQAADDEMEKDMLLHLLNHGDSVYMLSVRDRARLSNALDKLSDAFLTYMREQEPDEMMPWMMDDFGDEKGEIDWDNIQFATATHHGATIKYLTGLPVAELTPAYAVTDNLLIMSGNWETVRGAIDFAQDRGQSVVNTPLWAAARAHIPEGASGFSVGDTAGGADMIPVIIERMTTGQMAMLFGQFFENLADQDAEPMIQAIKDHGSVQVTAFRTIPGEGVVMTGRSPFGSSSIIPAGLIGGAGLGAYMSYTMMQAFQGDGMMMEPGMGDDWDF